MSFFSFFKFQTYIQTNKIQKQKRKKDTLYFYYTKHEKKETNKGKYNKTYFKKQNKPKNRFKKEETK